MATRSFTVPDLFDDKGRVPLGAKVRAYRNDTHEFVEEAIIDSHGNATFTSLPLDTDISFHAMWGGVSGTGKEKWFFSHIPAITEGGTGASSAAGACSNLGVGTEDSPQFTAVNLGHASDTTVGRTAAGRVNVEGKNVVRGLASSTDGKVARYNGTTGDLVQEASSVIIDDDDNVSGVAKLTTTGDIELGNASDTTLHRESAGVVSIEGSNIIKASDVDDTPVNGETTVPVSSNWAFDHAASAESHHAQQHAITSTDDHTSTATEGQVLKGDANGLPVDATNTDTEVSDAVTKAHTQLCEAADFTKLDGIEALADVTDATNVAAAGALMVANLENPPTEDEAEKTATSEYIFDHDAATTGVHGAGSDYLVNSGLFTPIAGEAIRQSTFSDDSPFTAKINGNPTSTSVVYDTDTGEGSIYPISTGASRWGRIVLHNLTRSNSRKIVSTNTSTNTITTEESEDDWADNDDITTQSQTNEQAGFFDVDLSAEVPATAKYIGLFVLFQELAGAADDDSRTFFYHPYEAYDIGKRFYVFAALKNEASTAWWIVPVISQKITLYYRNVSASMQAIALVKGYF